jgi:hypothetical protein
MEKITRHTEVGGIKVISSFFFWSFVFFGYWRRKEEGGLWSSSITVENLEIAKQPSSSPSPSKIF